MKTDKISIQRLPWALLAGTSALLLILSLVLLLSRFQALAQPAVEVMAANLEVQKEVNTPLAAPGDTLIYTITIQNTGDPAGDVWLTDTLPVELNCITESLTADFGSWGVEDDVITWTAEMQGYGQTAYIHFSAEISSDITCATVVNTAQVTGTGTLVERSATTRVLGDIGNLTGAKSVVPQGLAEPGDILTYTITIQNTGDPVGDVWLTDTLPVELDYITESLTANFGSWGVEDNVITWTAKMQGYGQTAYINLSAQIHSDYAGWITNTAEIVAPCQSFTRSIGTNVYQGQPDLEASKSVYPDWVHPSERLTYTVYIVNTGDGTVETAWMTDTLPSEVNYVSSLAATTGSCGVAGDVITWTGSLSPSEATTITFAVKITSTLSDNTRFTNTAEITGAGKLVLAQTSAWGMTHFDTYFPLFFYNYPPAPELQSIPDPSDHSYDVEWQFIEIPIDHYVLEQARTSDFSSVERSWTIQQTSQHVGDVYCAYYYRVRADKASDWGTGPWSNVEQGKASPPDPPVLNDIPDPDEDNAYTISWSSVPDPMDGVAVEQYVLQEATTANFSSVTSEWSTTGTSQQIQKGSADGTFYYRVRADDNDCWGQGGWSNVEQVTVVATYFDDFNDASSGWPNEAVLIYTDSQGGKHYWKRGYKASESQYRIKIDQGGPLSWFYQPDALAPYRPPSNKYCVETNVKFEDGNFWANMGLVFGANEDNTDIYALCLARGGESGLGWFLMRSKEYNFPRGGCSSPSYKLEGSSRQGTSRESWNRLQVGVNGDKVTVYIGGHYKGEWTMSGLASSTRVGVIGGDYEMTPIDIRFSYFRVIPNASCTP